MKTKKKTRGQVRANRESLTFNPVRSFFTSNELIQAGLHCVSARSNYILNLLWILLIRLHILRAGLTRENQNNLGKVQMWVWKGSCGRYRATCNTGASAHLAMWSLLSFISSNESREAGTGPFCSILWSPGSLDSWGIPTGFQMSVSLLSADSELPRGRKEDHRTIWETKSLLTGKSVLSLPPCPCMCPNEVPPSSRWSEGAIRAAVLMTHGCYSSREL